MLWLRNEDVITTADLFRVNDDAQLYDLIIGRYILNEKMLAYGKPDFNSISHFYQMTQFPDNNVQTGPDRGWSWVVAFAACFNSLVLAGIFRTSGVLFVAFINTFGVTREEASWPVVVCISVLNLTGPFSGLLGQKYGIRPVAMAGALIATIGISSCYFTTSLRIITLLFGVVFGIGYGLVSTLMPVIVNFYFLNLRATANGIANSGSCFGSLILPPFFELLISTYGLSGCFLLTGGLVLHIAIASALLRPPPWLEKSRKETRTLQIVSFYRKGATNQDVSCQQLRDVPSYNGHLDVIRTPISVGNGTRTHEKNDLFGYSLNAKSSSGAQYETQLNCTDPSYILEPKSAECDVSESLHNELHNSFEKIPYNQAARINDISGWRNKEFPPSK
ncbi:Monocarboxylate transporter 13, partial [Stegodyphus mimosarum]